jgi:hypothetical protein
MKGRSASVQGRMVVERKEPCVQKDFRLLPEEVNVEPASDREERNRTDQTRHLEGHSLKDRTYIC